MRPRLPGQQLLLRSIICVLIMGEAVLAQTSVDDLHTTPVSSAVVKQSPNSSLTSAVASFKSRVDLVMVPVSVTDGTNRIVVGLEKQNFEIYENKRLQSINTCSSEDAPLSVGIILDTSGSMQDKLAQARQAVYDFVVTANPDDEFFMITFSDSPVQAVNFGAPPAEIENQLLYLVPKGSTALLDALYLGITKMRSAKYSRRAILIVSDGGDNHSRYTEREVRRVAKEADVMIYAIGIYDRFFETEEERLGPTLLADLSDLTGGRDFVIESSSDLVDVANKIGIELRNQYVLSYTPKDTLRDGKWHKISVKLMPPKGLPALRAHAKEGYYAPIE